ncbi:MULTISPECIES: glycosyltransferase family 4 protein [unclassified Bacillus (in: firmicutes)]|uniref:glycosyltransferase family 4 protein n=1 Tax=unclassified Bacillus (in: firmicutes) TaxID=185979 RepID=UPI0008F08A6E|nr:MULTISPECIES: glycosyltransferase family 4 protein [unclassified Bacillus (in: firmicutes)]SFB21116.1 Glycosyltransferase involved in cell wall bisynthesis [Bacillus sp. UNCCL13]SFQ90967.1 Glycosyltransferase involved in cell wall bisynthesis [Bacillus sp. cl95]
MKVLHLNAGNETGGGMHHILLLLSHLDRSEFFLGVFEEGELAKRAQEMGIQTKVFPQSSRFDMSIVDSIAEYVKEHDIDIIHTHGARANLFGTFLKKKTHCQWVTTIHSDPRDDFLGQGIKGKVFTFLNIWSIKKTDHLFAISEKFNEIVNQSFKVKKEKITTILNGIQFEKKSTNPFNRSDLGLQQDDLVIIMVARLEKVKDHMTAFKALKMAVEKVPNIKLLLVGDGKEKEYLMSQSEQLGIKGNVKFLGHRDDVIDLYPLADLGLLTSKSESFPLVLLEAARAAVPVVTTDVGGVNKMIPDESHGWITGVGDVARIAQSITLASELKRTGELVQMGELFNQHCSGNFSIRNQVASIYDTYKKIL